MKGAISVRRAVGVIGLFVLTWLGSFGFSWTLDMLMGHAGWHTPIHEPLAFATVFAIGYSLFDGIRYFWNR